MADFIRSLLQVLLGFVLGVATMLFLIPANKTSKDAAPAPGAKAVATVQPSAAPGGAGKTDAEAGTTTLFGRRDARGSDAPAAKPEPVATVPVPPPQPEPEPVVTEPALAPVTPPVAVAEEPVDFRELCIKPAAWPPIITLNKEINAQVMQGDEVIAEIPLSAGEKLQVSKVFGDATAEVRAKGAKFIVKAADTDLAAQARVRLAEISGRPRAPTLTVTPAETTPAPKAPAKDAAPTPPPARSDDLDSKMRSLFGTPQKR